MLNPKLQSGVKIQFIKPTLHVVFTEMYPDLVKSLPITSHFEGGHNLKDMYITIVGNFDGAGVSAGALQWNFGSGTLQVLLKKFVDRYGAEALNQYFSHLGVTMSDHAAYRAPGTQAQDVAATKNWHEKTESGPQLTTAWKEAWQNFMGCEAMIDIQNEEMNAIWDDVSRWIKEWNCDPKSIRAHSLFLDIRTQNGSLKGVTPAQVDAELAKPNFFKDALDYMKTQTLRSLLPGKEDYLGMVAQSLNTATVSKSSKALNALTGVNVIGNNLWFDCRIDTATFNQVIKILGNSFQGSVNNLLNRVKRFSNFNLWQPEKLKLTPEIKRLFVIAYLRSKTSNPLWQLDVFNRKATIALGFGNVHGAYLDFSKIFES